MLINAKNNHAYIARQSVFDSNKLRMIAGIKYTPAPIIGTNENTVIKNDLTKTWSTLAKGADCCDYFITGDRE